MKFKPEVLYQTLSMEISKQNSTSRDPIPQNRSPKSTPLFLLPDFPCSHSN